MGKQNFLSGGFKGKVGSVIGAGWKDMLTIRAYTKPANPKTEKQTTVRNAFKLKVKAAQLANQCNYDSALFSSTSNTSWGLRMAAASSFYASDKNLLEFVPLIPYGYTPDYPTSADPEVTGGAVVLSWDSTDDLSARSVNVLIWALNDTSAEYEPVIVAGTVAGSSGAWTVTVSVPTGYSVGEESYLTAVSYDDASYSDTTLYQPPIKIGTSIIDVPFTLTLASGPTWTSGNDYVLFTFTPSETLSDAVNLTPTSSAYGVLQGDFVTDADTAAAQVISNVVTVAVPITLDSLGQRPLFVSGSSLTLGAFAYADDTYRYIFEGATFSLAETATQQSLALSSTTFQYSGTTPYITVNESTGWTINSTGNADINLVNSLFEATTLNVDVQLLQEATELQLALNVAGNNVWWGADQTITPSSLPTASKNGVTYSIESGQTFTLPPLATSTAYSYDFSNVSSVVVNLGSSGMYEGFIYSPFKLNTATYQNINALLTDSTQISQTGAVIAGSSDIYCSTRTSGYSPYWHNDGYFSTIGTGDVTISFTYNSNKTAALTVANTNGFVVNFTVPQGTYSFTVTPS